MNAIEQKCRNILLKESIDLDSKIDFEVNGTLHTLSFEYIIESFMQASEESQAVFLVALEKALHLKEKGVSQFFENMGQLLLMTHLSNKIEV